MTRTTTKAPCCCQAVHSTAPLIVLGYDENQKPRAAPISRRRRLSFVTKAAQLMDLKVYAAATDNLAALAKKLPEGRLPTATAAASCLTSGKACIAKIIVTLAGEPKAAVGKDQDEGLRLRPATPGPWDQISTWSSRHRPGDPEIRLVGRPWQVHRSRPATC